MPDDLIRYDILVQDALRGVLRKVLTEVSSKALLAAYGVKRVAEFLAMSEDDDGGRGPYCHVRLSHNR